MRASPCCSWAPMGRSARTPGSTSSSGDVNDQFWWYVARSSGMVAWAAAIGSLLVGMALSTRALGPRPRGPWLLDLHRFLAGLSVGVLGLHLVALVADTFVHFGFA